MATKSVLDCTGRYGGLVRNGLGGTLDKPCANSWGVQLYCSKADVDAWTGVAEDLWYRLRSQWNATAGAVAIPQEITSYVTQIENDYCTSDSDGLCTKYWLPEGSWWDNGWNAQAAAKIAAWCSRVACALELLDNVRGVEGPVEDTAETGDLGFGVIGEGVGKAIGDVGEGLGAIGKGVGQGLGGLGEGVGQGAAGLGQGVGQGVAGVGEGVGQGVGGLGQGLGQGAAGLGQGVGQGASGLGQGAGDAARGFGAALQWLPLGLAVAGVGALGIFIMMRK